jgi:hypothetical protein
LKAAEEEAAKYVTKLKKYKKIIEIYLILGKLLKKKLQRRLRKNVLQKSRNSRLKKNVWLNWNAFQKKKKMLNWQDKPTN